MSTGPATALLFLRRAACTAAPAATTRRPIRWTAERRSPRTRCSTGLRAIRCCAASLFSGRASRFLQAAALAPLAARIHAQTRLDVVTYTGYTYEALRDGATAENAWADLLEQTDYLIDGPFLLAEKSLELKFRGSRNQRILDMRATRAAGEPVLTEL